MKTIHIKHPLRDIVYLTRKAGLEMRSEVSALEAYRKAHDEVWNMKLLFEKERGNVLLTIIQINQLVKEREDLQDVYSYYHKSVGTPSLADLTRMDYKFQVELRDFQQQVMELHQATLRSYDEVRNCTKVYKEIIATYFRSEKPIDPLNFTVLNSVFDNHEDVDVDVVSLDEDLQKFLLNLTEVYKIMDDYIQQYNVLYELYSTAIAEIDQFSKKVGKWNAIWGHNNQ